MLSCTFRSILVLLLAAASSNCLDIQYLTDLLVQPKCTNALQEVDSLPLSCGQIYNPEGSFMHQVEDLLEHQCDLVDPIRGNENDLLLQPDQEVDFVIVGAGTAGSIVAGRLATTEEQWEVALLEAGDAYPTGSMFPGSYFNYAKPGTAYNWDFPLQPQDYACKAQPGGICRWPRGKGLGGTGIQHGMMYMRANPWDYNQLANLGIEGWSYEESLPYFTVSENNIQIGDIYQSEYHGTGGPVTISQFRDHPALSDKILAAGVEMGYSAGQDLNGASQLGFTLAQATHINGSRLSSYNAYVAPLVGKQNNLIVSPNTLVTRILFSNNTKAMGVEYVKNSQTFRVYARKEVIISAGTIQSPQILMISGLGPREQLEPLAIIMAQDMPMVGQNLQNHVSFSIKFLVNETCYEDLLNENTLYQYLTERNGPLTSTGLSQTTAFVRVNELDGTPETVPQIQLFFEGFLANCSLEANASNCNEQRYMTMTPTLLRPKSTGNITLLNNDPWDNPIIQPNYLINEDDRQTLIDAIYFTLNMSQTAPLKEAVTLVIPSDPFCTYEFGSDDYWRCAIQYWTNPENHQIGTCSMGTSIENSVVDNELKVHGIESLRVIDAAVIPQQVSGNANAPIMMVAEKGADLIKKTWAGM